MKDSRHQRKVAAYFFGVVMEIKINKEIKEYNKTMFFGLSVRQFVFFDKKLRFCPISDCGSGTRTGLLSICLRTGR